MLGFPGVDAPLRFCDPHMKELIAAGVITDPYLTYDEYKEQFGPIPEVERELLEEGEDVTETFDEHDLLLAACRPVDLTVMRATGFDLTQLPVIYSGSTKENCARCACEIWVGPRIQAKRVELPQLRLVCFVCVMPEVEGAEEVCVHNLGNPEGERKP